MAATIELALLDISQERFHAIYSSGVSLQCLCKARLDLFMPFVDARVHP
jgi:hypothetical protein